MKRFALILLSVALILGAAWFGAESWLARQARSALADSAQASAESVVEIRNPTRVGIRFVGLDVGTAQDGFAAPDLKIYAPVRSLNTMSADLPETLVLRVGGAEIPFTLAGGTVDATVSPTHGMVVRNATVSLRQLAMNGVPILDSGSARAHLSHMGAAAPQGARGAYIIDLAARGLDVSAGMAGVQPVDISGKIQLWTSALPDRSMLKPGAAPPSLMAAQTQGLVLTMGDLSARLVGRIKADENGLAAGEAGIYTKDARGFIEAAISLD